MTKRATMSEIAQRAGVSQATVSLVLNNAASARISSTTRKRVKEIADSLGYSRKSSLSSSAGTPLIGMLLDEVMTSPFAAPLIEGARLEAASRGALVAAVCTGGDPSIEQAAIDLFKKSNCAGVIYASLLTRKCSIPNDLDQSSCVLLNCHAPNSDAPNVVPGDVSGAFRATEHLIANGHKRIAHIQGEIWGEAARDRTTGYRRALATHDIPFDPALLVGPAWTAISAREVVAHLLELDRPPTAIFCFNDRVALGVYEVMAERGLRVPDDISIIGFDNDELAVNLHPPLTTMILPHEEMARTAVDLVLSHDPAAPKTVKIECEIVIRDSVRPPKN